MKIAIITFHAAHNCGSMLQSYALQQTLKKLNYSSEILNYSNKSQQHMYAFFRKIYNYHDILYNGATLLYYKLFRQHYNDYQYFLNHFLVLTKDKYEDFNSLLNIKDKYDCYITGSDQVWNICCPDFDDVYYLNFVSNNKLKIAYAPSFGTTCIQEKATNPTKYKNYINDIKYVSIRENNGAKWIKNLTGRDIPVPLDPTLLLSSLEYDKLISNFNIDNFPNEKYIFYYAFNYSDEVNEVVSNISKQTNLPVYIIDAKGWIKKAKKYGFKITYNSGPLTFLQLIKNSELVLTTSFHGTAFSIIYNKKFWFIDSKMHNKTDDRAITLLQMMNLSHRMKKSENFKDINIFEDIDYITVHENLKANQEKSIGFLKKSLLDS